MRIRNGCLAGTGGTLHIANLGKMEEKANL